MPEKEVRLIDANALLEQVNNEIYRYWNGGAGGYYLAEEALIDIESAPTIDPESLWPQWISVKDRLPEKQDIEVLVIATGKGGTIRLEEAYVFACYSNDEGWVLDEYPEIENPKIDWWMPLPEPPAKES